MGCQIKTRKIQNKNFSDDRFSLERIKIRCYKLICKACFGTDNLNVNKNLYGDPLFIFRRIGAVKIVSWYRIAQEDKQDSEDGDKQLK